MRNLLRWILHLRPPGARKFIGCEVQPVPEQAAAGGVKLGGAALDVGDELGAALLAERLGERAAVGGHLGPLARHLARDLEVELDAVGALPRPEGLVRHLRRAREERGARGQVEGVAVPLERDELVVEAGEQRVVAALRGELHREQAHLRTLGRVYAAERPEVGLLPVELTAEGRDDPLFTGLDDQLVSLQWHGDTFDLPSGAALLARSPQVPNQAFRAGERAYGVQFHLEVTGEMAREWAQVPAYRRSLAETLGEERGAEFIADVERRAAELHPAGRRLFGNWLDLAPDEFPRARRSYCLLYTSDAADDLLCVDLGGRRIIKK